MDIPITIVKTTFALLFAKLPRLNSAQRPDQLELQQRIIERELEQLPVMPQRAFDFFDFRRSLPPVIAVNRSDAASRHGLERRHPVLGSERVFDASQQVVRFQNQQHLPVDFMQHVDDVR